MSYSLNFKRIYNDGSGILHTITDLLSLKNDEDKITGNDYFKQESKSVTITFLDDNSDWIDNNIKSNITSYEWGYYRDFWINTVVLKKDGINIFTGYVKRTNIKYNKKTLEIKIIANDIMTVLIEYGKKSIAYDSATYDLVDFLYDSIDMGFITNQSTFNKTITNNYNLETGITATNQLIFNANQDCRFGNYDEWSMYTYGEMVYTRYGTEVLDNIILGERIYTMSKYWKMVTTFEIEPGVFEYTLTETIKWVAYTVTNDVVINELFYFDEHQNIFDADQSAYEDFMNHGTWASDERSLVEFAISLAPYGLALASAAGQNEFILGDDTYYIEDNGDVKYTGTIAFDEINLREGNYTYNKLVELLLILNNLAITHDNDGNIEIINKDYSTETVVIADGDIVEYQSEGLLYENLDYSSLLSPLVEADITNIADILNDYYSGKLPDRNIYLEIMNNYDLSLNKTIRVYGVDLLINSIILDNDNFIYKIEAWG